MEEKKSVISFEKGLHQKFLHSLDKTEDPEAIGFFMNEHLKLPGAYWCLTALDTMDTLTPEKSRKEEIISFIKACQHKNGGFSGNISHDPHLTTTHYAVLVLALYGAIDQIDKEAAVKYIAHLQNKDGSFKGDQWGEVDTRFSYCALSSLTLLDRLDLIDIQGAVDYVLKCKNMDGAFGGVPGAQSHAAYTFCGVGALAIAGKLDYIDKDELGHWLMNRQTLNGGFNGRPEKLPDVCYSWWVLSSCYMIERDQWIDKKKLESYILDCQDKEDGGIADRPGNQPDVFHTFFGVAALSLMDKQLSKMEGKTEKRYNLKLVDPMYALPVEVIHRQFKHISLKQNIEDLYKS